MRDILQVEDYKLVETPEFLVYWLPSRRMEG
jgi:hypothetical protein